MFVTAGQAQALKRRAEREKLQQAQLPPPSAADSILEERPSGTTGDFGFSVGAGEEAT